MSEPVTLADLPAPDEVLCRRILAIFAPKPTISEPLEIEVDL